MFVDPRKYVRRDGVTLAQAEKQERRNAAAWLPVNRIVGALESVVAAAPALKKARFFSRNDIALETFVVRVAAMARSVERAHEHLGADAGAFVLGEE
jgi:hypothetical protein